MKNRILIAIVALLLSVTFTSCYQAPKNDIAAYKTSTGEKYHRVNCRYVKGKAIDINLSRALYDGLEACKVCRPPKQADLDKLKSLSD